MVVVAVIRDATGALLAVRLKAGLSRGAWLGCMGAYCSEAFRLAGFARWQTVLQSMDSRRFAAKKRQFGALTTASPIATVPTLVVPSL